MKFIYIIPIILIFIVSCKEQKECKIKGYVYCQERPVPNIEFGYSLIQDANHSSQFRIGKTDTLGMFELTISSLDEDNIVYFGNPESMLATKKFTCDDVNKIDTIYLKHNLRDYN